MFCCFVSEANKGVWGIFPHIMSPNEVRAVECDSNVTRNEVPPFQGQENALPNGRAFLGSDSLAGFGVECDDVALVGGVEQSLDCFEAFVVHRECTGLVLKDVRDAAQFPLRSDDEVLGLGHVLLSLSRCCGDCHMCIGLRNIWYLSGQKCFSSGLTGTDFLGILHVLW